MEKENLYYKESGALGSMGPIYMGGLGLVSCLALGALYGYISFYNPLIYIGILITIGFGVAMGFVVGKAALWGKVRNQKAVMAFAALIGFLGVFFSWTAWIHAGSEQMVLTFSFFEILDVMANVAEEGAWSIFGFSPTGAMLYIIWIIEAGIIIGGTFLVALGQAVGKPYCENCDKWVESEVLTSRLDRIRKPSELVNALENKDFDALTSLVKVEHNATRRSKVELLACTGCDQEHYLTVTQIDVDYDEEGKPEEKEDELIGNLIITQDEYNALKEWTKAVA